MCERRVAGVPWDVNLAFSDAASVADRAGDLREVSRPTGSLPDDFELPGGTLPEDFQPPGGGVLPEGVDPGQFGGGAFRRSNVLERFHANAEFEALYQQELTELRSELYDSGIADEILARRAATLTEHAADLVDAATISEEADAIDDQFVAK